MAGIKNTELNLDAVSGRLRKFDRANWFDYINNAIMGIVIFATVYPFLYVISVSFSSGAMVGEISIFPKGFTTITYTRLLALKSFWISYGNTIRYTVMGWAIGISLTTLCAYPLSKKSLPGGRLMISLISFTMFFGGGLIPEYLVNRQYHLINTAWAIVLPGAISVWNMIMMRTFFKTLPAELEEAAAIDGMSDFGILVKIILPLSKSILATLSLFMVVGQWNNWFGPLIYLNDIDKYPVTMILRNILRGAEIADPNMAGNQEVKDIVSAPGDSMKSAIIVLTALPIMCVYPFVQKYFVKGMLIGSVKG
jgi:putative aldouronate transport system permease protein